MQIKLYSKPDPEIPPKKMVCLNRGIKIEDINKYLTNTKEDINPPEAFDEKLLHKGIELLFKHISKNNKIFIIVDCDPDGWTSAALLINYLYEILPIITINCVKWGLHEGKQHGLEDYIDRLENSEYNLIIVPDAGSNDIKPIERLHNKNKDVLILDHHVVENDFSPYAVTINSQYNYPNKELSGVGVVYKFCQYIDKYIDNGDHVSQFKDLTAIGLMADMMDIRSLETKEMIFDGLKDEDIRNPLILGLADKNAFALQKGDYIPSPDNGLRVTPMGAAFFIIPLINAMSRSGTMEEKELVFKAMLTMCAFEQIPSNKRGHKPGDMERVLDQALRCTTNVKNRQTRFEDAGMEILSSKAQKQLDNKVMVFVVSDEIPSTIGGLVANKLMAKYQRPVCVIRKLDDGSYAGSMRGYTATGIDNFMAIAQSSEWCNWVRGHENAAGISLNNINGFIQDMNEKLKNISTDIVYYVDYIYDAAYVEDDTVIALAELNDYLGTGFARPLIYVEDFTVTADSFAVMKSNTLKFVLPCGINIIKFGGTDEEIENIEANFGNTINLVCKCNIDEWNGERNPQLICVDYEIIKNENKNPLDCWDF